MRLVLLDRDGVINVDRPDSVKSREEFVLLPGVIEAIHALNQASIPTAIVTNQAVVGRGLLSEANLAEIHTYMNKLLAMGGAHIDKIYSCTSVDPGHPDRKPNPGLLEKAMRDFQVEPSETVMIGDALRDLEAAASVGCHRILVQTGKPCDELPSHVLPVHITASLTTAVAEILGGHTC